MSRLDLPAASSMSSHSVADEQDCKFAAFQSKPQTTASELVTPESAALHSTAADANQELATSRSDDEFTTDSDESTTTESEYYSYSDSGSDSGSDSDADHTPISSPVTSPAKSSLSESPTSNTTTSPSKPATSPADDEPVPAPLSLKTEPNLFARLGSRHPYATALGIERIHAPNPALPRLGRPVGPRAAVQKVKAQEAALRAWEEAERDRQRAWMRKMMGRDEFEW